MTALARLISSDSGEMATLTVANPIMSGQSLFRPLLSDDHKVGFFSSDRQVQTGETEIVEIKELTSVVDQLLEDSATMRKEIKFARGVMQAEFESKLQKKALELYKRINNKTTDIEKMHLERVATIRRAFKQQLADALGSVQNVFNKNAEAEKKQAQKAKVKEAQKWEGKLKELQTVIQHNESVIGMLKLQIAQLQEKEEAVQARKQSVASSSHSQELAAAREEVRELSSEIEQMEHDLTKAHQEIDKRDDKIDRLEKKIENMTEKLTSETKSLEKLKKEQGQLLQTAHETKDESKEKLEKQKEQLEKQFQEKLQSLQEQTATDVNAQIQQIQRENSEAVQKLEDEKRMLEELLAKEKSAKKSAKSADKQQLERVRQTEQRSLQTIARLKEDIERVNKTWEKKFEVLQRSMYALKDESYLRQTLLKQSAQLHQASIAYAGDPVRNSVARLPQPLPVKKDLHVEGKKAKTNGATDDDDAISYTVSVPSGRATTTFSVDENEIMSDTEEKDIDGEFKVLPVPSNHSRSGSSRSQVNVVLPKT